MRYKWIQDRLVDQGKTQTDLAKYVGIGADKLSKSIAGIREFTPDELSKIATFFSLSVDEVLAGGNKVSPRIPVLGLVGAGEQVIPIDDLPLTNGLHEHEYAEMNCEFVEAPPGGLYRDMVALKVKGDSMEPYLSEGDVVYYNQVIRNGFDGYLNKRVIVSLKDGRVFLKTLERGQGYGKYNLRSYNAKLIEGVELEWCARVAFIKPI